MKHWVIKKLGELSQKRDAVVSGPFGSNLKVSDYKTEGVPILRLQNIGKGFFIDKNIKYISTEKAEELKYHSFISGDIALAKLGIPIGKTCIIPEYLKSGIITADVVRIRPDKNVINYNFLAHFLNTDLSVSQLTGNISGATRPRVNLSDVRDIEVPLPSLHEQRRIVAILDEAFAAITKAKANAEQNLKNAKEIFENYLQSVLKNKGGDWEERRLGDSELLEIIDGDRGKNYPTQKDFLDEGYCLFLNTKNVRKDGFEFNRTMFINEAKDNAMGKGKLNKNDVVMTTRGTIGNFGVFNNEVVFDNIRINSGMLIFRPNLKKVTSEYLFEILRSGVIKEQIKNQVTGAAQPQLPIKTLVNFVFPVPKSLKTQQALVKKLDVLSFEIKKLGAIYQTKINNLEELKKSILQKAFSGELAKIEVAA